MKKFVESHEWEGKLIVCVYRDEEGVVLSFADGTYGRVTATLDEEYACIEDREYNDSIYSFRQMHSLGIVTDLELTEAEQRYQQRLKDVAEEQRQLDVATLRRLLAKYPGESQQ